MWSPCKCGEQMRLRPSAWISTNDIVFTSTLTFVEPKQVQRTNAIETLSLNQHKRHRFYFNTYVCGAQAGAANKCDWDPQPESAQTTSFLLQHLRLWSPCRCSEQMRLRPLAWISTNDIVFTSLTNRWRLCRALGTRKSYLLDDLSNLNKLSFNNLHHNTFEVWILLFYRFSVLSMAHSASSSPFRKVQIQRDDTVSIPHFSIFTLFLLIAIPVPILCDLVLLNILVSVHSLD